MNNPFGANWKTSVSGYTETLCAIVIALCILPSETWKKSEVWIPAAALIIAKTVKDSITKDRNVTGGSVQQDQAGSVAKPQEATPEPPLPALPDPAPDLKIQSTVKPNKTKRKPKEL